MDLNRALLCLRTRVYTYSVWLYPNVRIIRLNEVISHLFLQSQKNLMGNLPQRRQLGVKHNRYFFSPLITVKPTDVLSRKLGIALFKFWINMCSTICVSYI